MIEWWVAGIVAGLYGGGMMHGVALTAWSHRKKEEES